MNAFETSLRRSLRKPRHAVVAAWRDASGAFRRWRWRTFGRPYRWLESSKARPRRERENFFEKYCQGRGLDVGFGGDPVTPTAQGWDVEHGDAQYLKGVRPETYDFVYSSHTLEDMADPAAALAAWWRPVRPGGYLILFVPHRDLYEKRTRLPSRFNRGHKHFFLPDADDPPDTIGLRPLIGRTLPGAEIVYVRVCDEGWTVSDPDTHSDGEYSIEAVVRKAEQKSSACENS